MLDNAERELQGQKYQDAQQVEEVMYGGCRERAPELTRPLHVAEADERVGYRCPDVGAMTMGIAAAMGIPPATRPTIMDVTVLED